MGLPTGGGFNPENIRQELKNAVNSAFISTPDSDFMVQGEVKESSDGKLSFKIGDAYTSYKVSIAKDFLTSLTTDAAKQEWAKGLAIHLQTTHSYGATASSYDPKNRVLTINGKAYFFSTQSQINAHKQHYRDILEQLGKAKNRSDETESALKDATEDIADKSKGLERGHFKGYKNTQHSKILKREIKGHSDALTPLKTSRRDTIMHLAKLEAEARVMAQLHLIAGQLFVKEGIAPNIDPTLINVTLAGQIPNLPKMPDSPTADPNSMTATAQGTERPPSTYQSIHDLPKDNGMGPVMAGKTLIAPLDGMSPEVIALLKMIKEGFDLNTHGGAGGILPSINYLRDDLKLTRIELYALQRGLEKIGSDIEKNELYNKSAPLATARTAKEEKLPLIKDFIKNVLKPLLK